MPDVEPPTKPSRAQRGAEKTARNPVKIVPVEGPLPRKPPWIRVKAPLGPGVRRIKNLLREQGLHSVCEEAACPNLAECFTHGTATFMIMGDLCTRRCPFCDVAHGRPKPLDDEEPAHLAEAVAAMELKYVVVTSVDRDDLRDGGAAHFAACVARLRERCSDTRIEILVPDFRGRLDRALAALNQAPPDVFNHNLETVPRLYRMARPGADYAWSLGLLERFKQEQPELPTKSGLMLGLGEERHEVEQVLARYWEPQEFESLGEFARGLGFTSVASGPLVRSSYHADLQAAGESVA
jgi:lipoic acid synthetase